MSKIKMLFTCLICFLAFSMSAQSVVGKWKFEFPGEEGTTVIVCDMKADGTYTLDFGADGTVELNGKYTLSGDTMTFSDDGDCKGKGVYKAEATDTDLTMTKISDECEGRGGPEGKMMAKRM